ncbi:hypothetical protein VOLCADRAFT_97859 [Volvox carteri f. nagariensis]|uniref:Uncharacterized protein n=1 Tax=Volvox carteri f. nagariensis TaxID=3068 RepID=D8UDU3_VOLCA|nr:uncharacterized protein VOLCADRAFT_97859 [Volvox carteri f. nagariensis]EFJ42104.1 hypothetical protein VOLCADRAFT_97859 [Volvox carteri f. nagariensis]|eukprot:XP_002956801.1 hypothetical protein VOLCADRAFT_97859 [Volvox carteri f. nagariensis]
MSSALIANNKSKIPPEASLSAVKAKPSKQLRTEGTIGLMYTASPGTLERASYRPPAGRDPRVPGPDSRGVDAEGFRLVAGSTRNGQQYATFLRVGNLIELDGWEPTDHRPLTLVLNVTVDDESRCRDGKGRKARVEFDIARYQDYAEYFEGGSPTMNALSQVAEDLQRGVCNTTQAVERIGGALYKVLVGIRFGGTGNVNKHGNACWRVEHIWVQAGLAEWLLGVEEHCRAAHEVELAGAQYTAAPGGNQLP